jgi:hypothetical protein
VFLVYFISSSTNFPIIMTMHSIEAALKLAKQLETDRLLAEQLVGADNATATALLSSASEAAAREADDRYAAAHEVVARADLRKADRLLAEQQLVSAEDATAAANLRMSVMLQEAHRDNMRLAIENMRLRQECDRNARRIQESHAVISLWRNLFARIS